MGLDEWCCDQLSRALDAVTRFHIFMEHDGPVQSCLNNDCVTTRQRLTNALSDNTLAYHMQDVSATLGHDTSESLTERRNLMPSVPPPPPIKTGPREIHPIQMFYDKGSHFTDFSPHVLPADAEVEPEAPKGAGAIFMSSEEMQRIGTELEPRDVQETLLLGSPESETEPTSPKDPQSSAPTAAIPSPPNSSPTGSSPISTGKLAAPAPVQNTG